MDRIRGAVTSGNYIDPDVCLALEGNHVLKLVVETVKRLDEKLVKGLA